MTCPFRRHSIHIVNLFQYQLAIVAEQEFCTEFVYPSSAFDSSDFFPNEIIRRRPEFKVLRNKNCHYEATRIGAYFDTLQSRLR